MKPIGGFFELEHSASTGLIEKNALGCNNFQEFLSHLEQRSPEVKMLANKLLVRLRNFFQMKICIDTISRAQLEEYLHRCDADFEPALSMRVDLVAYCGKIFEHATKIEAWNDDTLAGLMAVYVNNKTRDFAFITLVHVFREYRGTGMASALLKAVFTLVASSGFSKVRLEVYEANLAAVHFYMKNRFRITGSTLGKFTMEADVACK